MRSPALRGPRPQPARRDVRATRYLYFAGVLAPGLFLLSVILGGARRPGYSHLADPVSALGMSGAVDAWAINGAWATTGLLIMVLGLALWRDRTGPGRIAASALLVAGAASAAIALSFPMDPPGVPMSAAQVGHNILVVVAAIAFAAALLASARSAAAPPAYRRLTWAALGAMALGGGGAALTHSLDLDWIGGFERITQGGYHVWLLTTGVIGLAGRWRRA
ncbi:MAG: DUF998 domain-containing protein [Brevundimonas sp.]|nr:DUF998 domain-containing protein [Brevundimonas sp.]